MMRQLLYAASIVATLALSRAIAESPPSAFAAARPAIATVGEMK